MPDPDLEIRGGRGGGAVSENTFSALGASVWSKKYEWGGGGEDGPPGPLPGSATVIIESS